MTEEAKKSIYVVMRRSGKVFPFRSGFGALTEVSGGPFLNILDAIYQEASSGGSTYDRPEKLFLNGTCVIESGLTDLAYKYVADKRDAQAVLNETIKQEYLVGYYDWLPDAEVSTYFKPKWRMERVQ